MVAIGTPQEALLPGMRLPPDGTEQSAERRKRLRIDTCYPARVRWLQAAGKSVKHEAVLDNLSSKGLYMRVGSRMVAGQRAFVVFHMADVMKMPSRQLASAPLTSINAPRIAVRGSVLRIEQLEGGLWGVVVVFKQHRFL